MKISILAFIHTSPLSIITFFNHVVKPNSN